MDLELSSVFYRFAVALGLGLLVGLQRERTHARLAGLRTFSLATVFGTLLGFLSQELGGLVLAAGFVAVAALLVTGNLLLIREETVDPGLTSEVALLVMFAVGALVASGPVPVAVALGGTTAILLHMKEELHELAGGLGEKDLRAIMQFVLVSLVILPLLPDRAYGPYGVLNPREIWWMVVLVVGVSLGGYLTLKRLGPRRGSLLGGLLGGLVSSTATTVSFARRSVDSRAASRVAVVVVTLASAVVFVRVLVELAVVAPSSLAVMAPPIVVLLVVLLALALTLWWRTGRTRVELPEPSNPSELGSALLFAGLYALVILMVTATQEEFGDTGLFVAAALSGLTDMDAITLSTAQLVRAGRLEADPGWRLVVIGALSNLVFKGAAVAVLGDRHLLRRIAVAFGSTVAVGVLLLVLWP